MMAENAGNTGNPVNVEVSRWFARKYGRELVVMTEADMRDLLSKEIEAQGSATAAARSLGISPQYLSNVLVGRDAVSRNLAGALGYEAAMVFFRKKANA